MWNKGWSLLTWVEQQLWQRGLLSLSMLSCWFGFVSLTLAWCLEELKVLLHVNLSVILVVFWKYNGNLPQTLIWKGNRLARVKFQYLGWLQLALPTIVTHAASFLVWRPILVQWAYLVMINVTTSPSITNLTIKLCHNKAHSCAHTHTRERDMLQEWKAWYKSQVQIDSHRSPNLTWSISWQQKIVLFAANIHIKEITHTTAEKYYPDHSPDQVCLLIAAKLNSPKWIDDQKSGLEYQKTYVRHP
jgi:hypothetical protein